ncbi:phage terminase large subunit [Frankia sp. CcI6]|uniref:phage terminase large subunit n=1 Tax=unclassified Frankia TaxID=2632575 RepID=UPI0003CFC97B|nr:MULTISPECIES: phage terminase large subunit [unclassified Frankia]ETA00407.1 phage terminase large subunit [Frankia sp. CcI6]KFB03043.1 phage terminase large subunit [Frankia sp. Allo2]OHV51118.1 hypothetical protein CgIS1_19610 [Frankia sp. CgIS1]
MSATIGRPETRTIAYRPRGGAAALLTARDAEICFSGPAGTGKSLAALWKVHLTCMAVPGTQALILRQTNISLAGTTLNLFERFVVRSALDAGIVAWFGGSPREAAKYRYQNGSTIIVGGLDQPTKFLSSELDIIFVDEATEISKTAYETVFSRLRGTALADKQIILACNPSHPKHWIKLRCDQEGMRMVPSRHRDNPVYVREDGSLTEAGRDYIVGKLGKLTGVRKLRYLDGIWAAAEGVIYEEWDDSIHVVDPFKIPRDWTIRWAVDFGFVNPFTWQLWAEDPDGGLWLVREIYRTGRTVADHCQTIREAARGFADPLEVVCDHDAEDRATLERELGYSTCPATKNVSRGIQAVKERLSTNRLKVFRDSLVERDHELAKREKPGRLAEEIPQYVWASKSRRAEDGERKDEPLKENDHAADAMRYVVAQLDLRSRPGVRFLE